MKKRPPFLEEHYGMMPPRDSREEGPEVGGADGEDHPEVRAGGFRVSKNFNFKIWHFLPELETIEFQCLRNAVWRRYLPSSDHVTRTLKFYSCQLRSLMIETPGAKIRQSFLKIESPYRRGMSELGTCGLLFYLFISGKRLLFCRGGHFRYFWIFWIIKNGFLHFLSR